MSTDLDGLKAKARAVKEATKAWAETLVDVSLPGGTTSGVREKHERNCAAQEEADAALWDTLDPDTILDLIERVRAGEELYGALTGHAPNERYRTGLALGCDWWLSTRDRAALNRWESLAHSPQEAP